MGWFTVFRSRRMVVLFLLGFSSGLPLIGICGGAIMAPHVESTKEMFSLERRARVTPSDGPGGLRRRRTRC